MLPELLLYVFCKEPSCYVYQNKNTKLCPKPNKGLTNTLMNALFMLWNKSLFT